MFGPEDKADVSQGSRQYNYTRPDPVGYPCALVFVRHGIVQRTRTSDTWEWPPLENESEVHPHSGAGEYHALIASASHDREAGDAGCEDTLVWPEQRVTVSLLWTDKELG